MTTPRQVRNDGEQHLQTMEQPTFKYGLTLRLTTRDLHLENTTPKNVTPSIQTTGGDVTTQHYSELSHESKKTLHEHLCTLYQIDEHKLTAYHAAHLHEPLLIHVRSDHAQVTIKHDQDTPVTVNHVVVIAEPNTTCNITEIQEGNGQYTSHGVEIIAKRDASVTYETCQDTNSWHFAVKRARGYANSTIQWFTASLGDHVSKTEVSTDIQENGGTAYNYGIFYGNEQQRFDIYNQSSHEAPHVTSDMQNKGIVTDRAKSIYRGLIDIGPTAHDSQGYQTEDTLILSDDAEADAVPNLEIENNDVQCSHGATIGRVDDNQLHYMRTRGLTREQAERAIINGFLTSMTEKIQDETLRQTVNERVQQRI